MNAHQTPGEWQPIETAADRRCGTCDLWGIGPEKAKIGLRRCVADTAMDLPASWTNRTVMAAFDGSDCPIWRPEEPCGKQWRCVGCKGIFTQPEAPQFCGSCQCRTFAEIDRPGSGQP